MPHEVTLSRGSGAPSSCDGVIAAEHEDWCFCRTIAILGPGDRLDAEALGRAVGSGSPPLLLLSVGYPPTPDQRAGVRAAMWFATEREVCFEARLAWSMDEALDLVSPFDEVLRCLSERAPLWA